MHSSTFEPQNFPSRWWSLVWTEILGSWARLVLGTNKINHSAWLNVEKPNLKNPRQNGQGNNRWSKIKLKYDKPASEVRLVYLESKENKHICKKKICPNYVHCAHWNNELKNTDPGMWSQCSSFLIKLCFCFVF